MTLTLTLREQPVVPLEAETLRPDRLAASSREEIAALPVWHGNERTRVGEFFAVSGAGDDVRLEGDLSRVKFVGAGMTAGRLTVAGSVGYPGGFSGDGGLATLAQLRGPSGVAVTTGGDILVADTSNNRVRLVDADLHP